MPNKIRVGYTIEWSVSIQMQERLILDPYIDQRAFHNFFERKLYYAMKYMLSRHLEQIKLSM